MTPTATAKALTSGRRLARGVMWNLVGQVAPILAGVVALPVLLRFLGVDRLGVITLSWMVIGYFNVFDLGLGRAITKLIAEKLGAGGEGELRALAGTGLLLMGAMGLVGTVSVGLGTHWLVRSGLHIPPTLQYETRRTAPSVQSEV